MPISLGSPLQSISRRQWLSKTLYASAARGILASAVSLTGLIDGPNATAGTVARRAIGSRRTDGPQAERFALFADTHIASDANAVSRGCTMASQLRTALGQLEQFDRPRSNPNDPVSSESDHADRSASADVALATPLIILGDLALTDGQPGDYAQLANLLEPSVQVARRVHLTLGNHDDRAAAVNGLERWFPPEAIVQFKLATIIEGRMVDWLLLDTLEVVNQPQGMVGTAQLEWLDRILASRAARPTLIGLHHPIQLDDQGGFVSGDLQDARGLCDVIRKHRHVDAVVFGHTHRYSVGALETDHGRVALVNLPPTAYVFDPTQPSGWIDLQWSEIGMQFTLHTIDPADPRNGQQTHFQRHRA
jgi:3',5'-cyclic-AMP phosphodiesterase